MRSVFNSGVQKTINIDIWIGVYSEMNRATWLASTSLKLANYNHITTYVFCRSQGFYEEDLKFSQAELKSYIVKWKGSELPWFLVMKYWSFWAEPFIRALSQFTTFSLYCSCVLTTLKSIVLKVPWAFVWLGKSSIFVVSH